MLDGSKDWRRMSRARSLDARTDRPRAHIGQARTTDVHAAQAGARRARKSNPRKGAGSTDGTCAGQMCRYARVSAHAPPELASSVQFGGPVRTVVQNDANEHAQASDVRRRRQAVTRDYAAPPHVSFRVTRLR